MEKPEARDARSTDRLATAGLTDAKPASPADTAWKRALRGVTTAAFRLHHYRFVRTRMLHDALSAARENEPQHRS